jgi:hypothetical protein
VQINRRSTLLRRRFIHTWRRPPPPHAALPRLDSRFVTTWSFDRVCITCESDTPPDSLQNIQQYTVDGMQEQCPGAWIIIDDGAGEIADVIVVDPPDPPRRPRGSSLCTASTPARTPRTVEPQAW